MKARIRSLYNKIIIERYPTIFRPTSHPFISGDTFRNYADHIFDEATSFKSKEVKKNDVVFINADLIEIYFRIQHPTIENDYILISHNSDRNIDEKLIELADDKIIHWFVQNLVADSNNKVSLIPIGLENKRWLKHGRKKWFNIKNEFILSAFNTLNNYKERNPVNHLAEKAGLVKIKRFDKISVYFNELAKYKFVLCPSGNGVDTHRIWECVIHKSIPILVNNSFSVNLKKLGLPALFLDSWDELIHLSEKDLNRIYGQLVNEESNFIYIDYWIKIIEEKKL